ncbi:hypothetical protein WMF38_57785 [Sorangium sp. So ce118]
MTTETRAKVHVVLGRLIVALQYAGRTNLAGRLTPQPAFGTAKALTQIADLIPRDGRNAFVREAASVLSDAYVALATNSEAEARAMSTKADNCLIAFFNSAAQPT